MNQPITRRSALALAAVCLSSLMFGLEISSIPAILPTLEQVLGADFKQLQWIMNAYTIAVTAVLMGAGTLADRYGRKRIFVAGIIAFGIASLICGLTDNISVLIVARFLQGMAGGVMLICQIAVLSQQFQSGRQRGIAFSWWGIIFGIGLGFGPIVGGATVALLSWEWVFLVHVLLSGVTVALALAGVKESRDPGAESLDVAGIVTLSAAVFCIAYFITQGPELGFASPTALSILGIAIVSLIGFVIAEKVSARPMFDFSVFR
ncbi:MAG: MFS transporter, partial [Ensifer adhaerens]